MEIDRFNREKMKAFNLNRDSRPSDPEHPDMFRPTVGNFKDEPTSFEQDERIKSTFHEGVDDYDGEDFPHKSLGNGKIKRTSLVNNYNEAI